MADSLYKRLLDLNPLTAAYLAGLIDGEGNIGAYTSSWKSKPRPVVKINMTCKETIEFVAGVFGGTVYSKKVPLGNQPQWHWGATSNRAIIVLHTLLPHLRTKRALAEDVLNRSTYRRQGSKLTVPARLPPDSPEVLSLLT